MPTSLTLEQHLAGLHAAMLAFARHAGAAGLDVPVPTCPEWTVRRLVGHQGAVHRWAAGALRGEDLDWAPVEKAGRSSADPVDWLRDGAIALVRALVEADDDTPAPVFLADPPASPRRFWARRLCHETTIHGVDALAADLGRLPRAEETWIERDLALDGLDELLLGFVPRERSRLRTEPGEAPVTLVVRPTDADHAYTVRVSDDVPVTVRHDDGAAAAGDREVTGNAVQLYLALWHRSDELAASDVWPLWHHAAVR
ncbi:maleylpyruvate isomerase family mycothiol-dependent enzyme [Nocardioides marinquilinus]|uniref:Maleylpyruvate isomerase family mycothiol-dependent enzyme n=1 Tax=Nocardioides marinquilinus TaxID=1210400 RepID=A0ABP9PKQ4_9ACTN